MHPPMVVMALSALLVLLPARAPAQPPAQPLPEVSWEDAAAHVGEQCVVVGKVVLANNIGSMCFLNFHRDFRNHFTVVIRQESFERFPQPPEILYDQKQIRVTGTIIEYRGQPEIIVAGPEQIQIVEPGPADRGPADPPSVPPPPSPPAPPPPSSPPVPAAPPPAQPAARAFDGTVTIASFNVLNLFDDVDDPYRADEGTPPKPAAALETLAATIRKVDADVLALQEVENRGILEQFNQALLDGMGYEHAVLFEGNDRRGIDVAVLSRLPVGPVTSHRHLTFQNPDGEEARFRRDLLQVRIEPPGARAFDVFVAHLKSKRGGDAAEVIRMGEAAAARRRFDDVLNRDPQALFVLCGDLNDAFESEPIRTLVGSGSAALHGHFGDVPQDQRITFNQEPYRSMIDFILCSPAMALRYQPGSFRVYPGTVESAGSDHNPISARFDLK